jgi:hypothetical protein
MTQLQDNRCFGRLKAQELSEEEIALVGGSDPDVFHHFLCPNQVSEGNENQPPCYIGCVYT